MMKNISAYLFLLFFSANASHAAIVTWSFSGAINELGLGDSAEPIPGINIGDAVTGTIVYDTNTLASDLGWATGYSLTSTGGLLSIEVSGQTFSSAIAGSDLYAQVYDDRTPSYGDVVLFDYTNAIEDEVVTIQVADEIAPYDLLSDESLPTYLDFSLADELNPGGLGGNYGFIQAQGLTGATPFLTAHFSIDSLTVSAVPVPAAVWLLGSGLLALIGVARRKKT